MLNIKNVGKYLDQPLLVGKFAKSVPYIMLGSSALYTANKTLQADKGQRKSTFINTSIVLGSSVASALIAPRIAAGCVGHKFVKTSLLKIRLHNKELVDEFVKNGKADKTLLSILNKAKRKVLSLKDISFLSKKSDKNESTKIFFNKLIPEPKNINSKEIFGEIGRLSILGLVPVTGGIAGGIAADRITDKKNYKSKIPNKIKEGVYQYLANIFLCNIGAAGALSILENRGIKSKSARAVGMVTGILATGVIGGSYIANYISRKLINPIFDKNHHNNAKVNKYSGRKPELLDLCLHSDDIATVAVMSGLKWIEPALPILYGISGYRAGIGYRNRKNNATDINC